MSLRTIGYTPEGRPIKEDLGPSYARVPSHGGSLVSGGSGPVQAARSKRKAHALTKNQTGQTRAAAYERTKRYRARQKDAA